MRRRRPRPPLTARLAPWLPGAHAVLVGETLMRAPSPGAGLAALLGG